MVKLVRLTGSAADVKKVVADLKSNVEYDRTPVRVEISKLVQKTVFTK